MTRSARDSDAHFSPDRRRLLALGATLASLPVVRLFDTPPGRSRPAPDALHYLGLVELTRLIRSRQISPVEVVRRQLDRIGAIDRRLHGYVLVTPELALERARAVEREIAAARDLGPLHGAPIGVKDMYWTRGVPTGAGTRHYANFLPPENAACVDRLLDAGTILLGKLTTTEYAGASYHPDIPAARNPWHPALWAGASSSGSGVATAAGLCYGSLGTDTGGSIRLPAAVNGVTGLKPTWGRVSRYGVFRGAESLDHFGPMARSAEDAAALFAAIAGPDPRDPTTIDQPPGAFSLVRRRDLAGVRVGIDPDFCLTDIDSDTRAALDACLAALQALGAEIREVAVPDREGVHRAYATISAVEFAANGYAAAESAGLRNRPRPSDDDYRGALERRSGFRREMERFFAGVDVLLTPVIPLARVDQSAMDRLGDDPGLVAAVTRFTSLFNVAGVPTLVVPAGENTAGGPVSMQLVGAPYREDLLLQTGYAFQQATAWHRRHPDL